MGTRGEYETQVDSARNWPGWHSKQDKASKGPEDDQESESIGSETRRESSAQIPVHRPRLVSIVIQTFSLNTRLSVPKKGNRIAR